MATFRGRKLQQGGVAALGVAASYYLVTQVRHTRRLAPHANDIQEALGALRLGAIGSRSVIGRHAESIKVLAEVLPLVQVEPLSSLENAGGVAVMERPERGIHSSSAVEKGPLAEIYFQLASQEVSPQGARRMRASMPSDQLLRESERILSPKSTEADIDTAVEGWRSGMLLHPEPPSPQQRLRQLECVERALDRKLAERAERGELRDQSVT